MILAQLSISKRPCANLLLNRQSNFYPSKISIMKTLMTLTLLTLLACNVFAQETSIADSTFSKSLSNKDLGMQCLQKSKNQKTAGWVLFGCGFTCITIATVMAANDFSNGFENLFSGKPASKSNDAVEAVLGIGGAGMMLGSIPLFIAHGKNKRKANLLLNEEKIMLTPKTGTGKSIISVGFAIAF